MIWFIKYLGQEWVWVNRKFIYFSIVLVILMFYYGFILKEVFVLVVFVFGFIQLWFYLKWSEFLWYQFQNNYGEVFFVFFVVGISYFMLRNYLMVLFLVMVISDGVIGIIRYYYFRWNGFNVKFKKYWIGSLGYLVMVVIIVIVFFEGSIIGKIGWVFVFMLVEYQLWVDDNFVVFFVGFLFYFFY